MSPWGGLVLIREMLNRIGLENKLHTLPLPSQGSNRGYDPAQILLGFMVGVWCGANSYEQLDVTRQDEVIRELFGWKRIPGHRTYQRYFEKFDQATNQRVFDEINQWFFDNLHIDKLTLDVDSTVMTRYGNQEGAAKGYNPQKRGRKSHPRSLPFCPISE